jgi:hypothetical protein
MDGDSGSLLNRYLLEEMRYEHDPERQARQGRGKLYAELRGSVFGREFRGH